MFAHPFGPFHLEHPKDLLATIVGLVLLLLLLYRFALPGAKSMLTTRAADIETKTLQIERQLSDVAQLRNDYANRIAGIEQEQRERIAAAVRDADNARTDIIAEAQETALALRRRNEEEMDRERTRQRILMRQQMVQITMDAAEQAIRAQNSDQVQRQLIRDFIGQVAHNGHAAVQEPEVRNQVSGNAVGQSAAAVMTPTIEYPLPNTQAGAMSFGTPTPGTTTTEDTAFPNFNSFNAPSGQEEA